MATQTSNYFKEMLAKKVIDFVNDTFKIALMEAGFVFSRASHQVFADVVAQELPTAYGYTAGGATLAGVSVVNDGALALCRITWSNVSWTAAGGNIQAAAAIIYDDTVVAPGIDPIVGCIDFGSSILTYNGGVLTIANPTVAIR